MIEFFIVVAAIGIVMALVLAVAWLSANNPENRQRGKMPLLFLFLAASAHAQEIPAPAVDPITSGGTNIVLTWRHPSCWHFIVREQSDNRWSAHHRFNFPTAKDNGQRQFTARIEPHGASNIYIIHAIDENGKEGQWSTPQSFVVPRERQQSDGTLPPMPDPNRRITSRAASMPAFIESNATVPLALTWEYIGEHGERFFSHILESTNLTSWSTLALIPSGAAKYYVVPPRPRSFFAVAGHDADNPSTRYWGWITNLVMDP